jgi:uncharacterized membrane protein
MPKLLRAIVCCFAAVLLSLAAPAWAHENHDELGAGPGSAEQVEPAPMPRAGMADMHENMAMGHEMAAEAHEEAADENKTLGQRLVSWLGRLHTVVIHFPIAMFVGAFGVELFALWRRKPEYQQAAYVMLVVGAIGAVAAALLGWFAGGFYLTDRNIVLMIHRWLGTAIAVFAVVLVYLTAAARRRPEQPRPVYLVTLGLVTLAIAVQGYLGGTFMHGGMGHLAF